MNATGWAISIGNVLPWLIILIGCIVFAARMKSCVSWGLVLAAVGQFVMAVFEPVYRLVVYRELMRGGDFDVVRVADISVNVLSILTALVFAVLLVVALFGKTHAPKASATPAPSPQPASQPSPPPPPSQVSPPPPPPQADA